MYITYGQFSKPRKKDKRKMVVVKREELQTSLIQFLFFFTPMFWLKSHYSIAQQMSQDRKHVWEPRKQPLKETHRR
jgi:hypothetical protein